MLGTVFTTAIYLSTLSALPQEAPPGLVFVKGVKTTVGSDPKDVEPFILANEDIGNVFAGETPKNSVEVADFYLGVTEVTNEQYAAFIAATGGKPPYLWGDEALNEGRKEHAKKEQEKYLAAKEKGERYERKTFDAESWWDKNWQGAKWAVPDARKTHPVTFVTYSDANAYAKWAGLRLMTEFEFQCAARGGSDRVYPWGDDWAEGLCQSNRGDRDDSAPVASFEKGSVNGIYDLAGNVWEWTSSPYTAFKKYQPLKIKTRSGKKKIEKRVEAGFDPNMRVLVSGSYKQAQDGCRIPTRMPTGRNQAAEALGFRVAASKAAGLDVARTIIEDEIEFRFLPENTEFLERATLIKQRWVTDSGSVQANGYGIITGHERMLFTPVSKIEQNNLNNLAKLTLQEPIVVGFLSLSKTLAEPLLDGGTYHVYYRAANKLPKIEKGESAPAWAQVDGFDEKKNLYFLYTTDGTPQVAFEAEAPAMQRMAPGSVNLEPYVPPEEGEYDENNPPPPPRDTLRFTFTVQSKKKRDGFKFDLPILLQPGDVDDTWK